MSARRFPKFPLDAIAALGLGLAVTAAAVVLTMSPIGDDVRTWWNARGWQAAHCEVVRPLMHPDGLLYGYELGGQRYQSSRVAIGGRDSLRAALSAADVGAQFDCWIDPRDPASALLDRTYDGWWWLPLAWVLGVFLTLSARRGVAELWRWMTFKPELPLTWSEWLRSFYQGNAWGPTLIGLCGLAPGLLAVKFMTFDPSWHWWRAQQWEATSCVIVPGKIRWHGGGGFPRRSWQGMDLAFAYEHGGKRYVSSTYSPWHVGHTDWIIDPPREVTNGKIIERTQHLVLGSRHTCYMSSKYPHQAFLYRGWYEGAYAIAAIGPSLCVLGLIAIAARPRY